MGNHPLYLTITKTIKVEIVGGCVFPWSVAFHDQSILEFSKFVLDHCFMLVKVFNMKYHFSSYFQIKLSKSVKGKPNKKTSQKMDPCITLCYSTYLQRKTQYIIIFLKGRDGNPSSLQGEVQGK
jgi:hypothetical protein